MTTDAICGAPITDLLEAHPDLEISHFNDQCLLDRGHLGRHQFESEETSEALEWDDTDDTFEISYIPTSEAVARQAAEGVKIDISLTQADAALAAREQLDLPVQPHDLMPPGSGMAPIHENVISVTITVQNH